MKSKIQILKRFVVVLLVYVIPVSLILNWLLNPSWEVTLTNCINVFGEKVRSYGTGFPLISHVSTCGDDCLGADYMNMSYPRIYLNGSILLLLAFAIYFFVLKKIKLNGWQSVVWCSIIYSSFGMFLLHTSRFVQCGTFGYSEVDAIHFNFDVYHLLIGIGNILFFGNFYLLAGCIILAYFIFRAQKKKNPDISKWWLLFYIYWCLFFFIIFVSEIWFAIFDDQMITSSGDETFRQHWVSIIIGYSLVIFIFVISRKLLIAKRRYAWISVITLAFTSLFIVLENQHCIVCGTNGDRFVEFYTPFYER